MSDGFRYEKLKAQNCFRLTDRRLLTKHAKRLYETAGLGRATFRS